MPVVRLDNVDLLPATQPLGAADRHRELHPFRGELLDPLLQGEPLLASRGVRLDRFVDRVRHYGDGVHAGVCSTIVLADGGMSCIVARTRRHGERAAKRLRSVEAKRRRRGGRADQRGPPRLAEVTRD
jgi:hypothetical protein